MKKYILAILIIIYALNINLVYAEESISTKQTVYTVNAIIGGDSIANAVISQKDIESAIKSIKQNKNDIITFKINSKQKTSGYSIKLSSSTNIEISNDWKINIETPLATIHTTGKFLNTKNSGGKINKSIDIHESSISNLIGGTKGILGNRSPINIIVKINNEAVTFSSDISIFNISIPYEANSIELNKKENLVLVNIDKTGSYNILPSSRYDNINKVMACKDSMTGMYGVAFITKTFSDTADYKWAQHPIEVLASRGIINGIGNNKFAPGNNITRADFVYIIVNALGLKSDSIEVFTDVYKGAYYAKEVGIAKNLGIIQGIGKGKFNPTGLITKQDMMVVAYRASSLCGRHLYGTENNLSKYKDKDNIAVYARESVKALTSNNMITWADTDIKPKEYANRAEAATLIYNLTK